MLNKFPAIMRKSLKNATVSRRLVVAGITGGVLWEAFSRWVVDASATDKNVATEEETVTRATAARDVRAESHGAVGDGVADDTRALNSALATGNIVRLRAGSTYKITSSLVLVSGGGIVGDSTTTIKASATDFTATRAGFGASAVLIHALSKDRITLRGFRLQMVSARNSWVHGIALQNVTDFLIEDIEAWGFNRGYIIALDSVRNGAVRANHLRDSEIDATAPGQLSGICVDDNRVRGKNTAQVLITDNKIHNLTVTAAFNTAFGYQTDAINTHAFAHLTVSSNVISNVGEGIDHFAEHSIISGNLISDCIIYGIKIIHGAQHNVISGNVIDGAGLANIIISGSSAVKRDTAYNLISGNILLNPGTIGGAPTGVTVTGLHIDNGHLTYKPNDNVFSNNILGSMSSAGYALTNDGLSTGNKYINNQYDGTATVSEYNDLTGIMYLSDTSVAARSEPETLTNKTLVDPVISNVDINSGAIDGTALGADAPSTVRATDMSIGTTANGQKFHLFNTVAGAWASGILLQNRSNRGGTEIGLKFITAAQDETDDRYASVTLKDSDLHFRTANGAPGEDRLVIEKDGTLDYKKPGRGASVPANFSADNYLTMKLNGTTVYIPCMTAPW